MTVPKPRLAELSRDVAGSVNRLVAIAGTAGRPELGALLVEAARRWPDPQATVVVIGEPRSGRTTVVNALAGTLEPPLLPLGAGLTVVRSGTPSAVVVHEPGEPPDVRSLHDPGVIPPTASVEVVLPDVAVGADLVLVDGPAVDGPRDPRLRVVEAILATADAVVLVTRADAPLSGPELDLLAVARRRTGAAVLVITGVDRHRGWRTVLDESRRSVEARGASLLSAPPVPFAAPLAADAEAAARLGAPDACDLEAESGLAALRATVRTAIGDRFRLVRLLGLVEMAKGVAGELEDDLGTAGDGSEAENAMAAAALRLRASRDAAARAGVLLGDGFTILRESLTVEVGRDVGAVLEEVEASMGESPDIDGAVELAQRSLEAARLRIDGRAVSQLESLMAAVLRDLAGEGDGDAAARPPAVADTESGPAVGDVDQADGTADRSRSEGGKGQKTITASMRLRLVQALLSSTAGVALLATINATGGMGIQVRSGSMGVGMLVGGVAAAEGFREAKRQRTSSEARARIRTVVEQWRAEYLANLRERLLREQRTQETALRDALRAQAEEAEAQMAELKQATQAAVEDQRRRGKERAEARAALRQVRTRLGELAAVIAAP